MVGAGIIPTVRANTSFPRWLPAVLLAAVSLTSSAMDVDDMERFTYINNVTDPSPFVWGYGYFDMVPSLLTFVLAPLPLPMQAVTYRLIALGAALLLYRELRRLFATWHPSRGNAAAALSIMLLLHLVEPWLLANLSWINWSLFLAAVTYLLATARRPIALPPVARIAVTTAFLTTPAGVIGAPLLLAGAIAGGRVARDRVIIAVTVAVWHTAQAIAWPGEWVPRPASIVTAIAGDFTAGVWRHNMIIAAAALLIVATAFAAAWRWRTQALEHAMLCYLAWASLVTFVLSSRLTEQGFEPRYVLIAAFCAIVAVADGIFRMPPAPSRIVARAGGATAILLTLITINIDRRGPFVLWWQKVQFTAEAAAFRQDCRPGDAVTFEDESVTIVIECRRLARPPGVHRIIGARPKMGVYQDNAPLEDRPAIVVPDRIFR